LGSKKSEEIESSRKEIYWCEGCGGIEGFERFNGVKRIGKERKGRCGEYR